MKPGKIEVLQDPVADKLDELADLSEYWTRNREKGRMPYAIRGALIGLCREIAILGENEDVK